MFVREKRINGYTYLYLVETVREDGRAKQRIIKNLGRKEAVTASGALERLASSVARYAERAVVFSQIEAGNPERLACKRIGAPLLFGRLWEETGCRAVIEDLLSGRAFEFAVERVLSGLAPPPLAEEGSVGYRAASHRGADADAVLGMRIGSRDGATRAHRPGLSPVPLPYVRQAVQ